MTNLLIRLVLIAGAFYFVLPMIQGIEFHGSFVHAIVAGFIFALVGWGCETLAIILSTVLAIGTFGLALLILIPAWMLGFWLLPAVALKVLADMMPATLTISGWGPAIWGGLVMLFIGVITSGKIRNRKQNA
jgi:uncharacterized membrane protein YvlD (DUF360 family)